MSAKSGRSALRSKADVDPGIADQTVIDSMGLKCSYKT